MAMSSVPLQRQFATFARDYPYREIDHGGLTWRYRMGGPDEGPAVLVLAGATMVPDPLFVVISALGDRYRVIAPAYPPATAITDLVAGIVAVLDAEQVRIAHVVGSSFGGYLAQSFVRAHPDRVARLVLAQTGVRHFVGAGAIMSLREFLRLAPTPVVKAIMWRTWQALLADLGEDRQFWSTLLRDILDHQLTKGHLLAVMGAMADFTANHRPLPGPWLADRPVLVLASQHDRAFAKQSGAMRAVYPRATYHTLEGAGHGALFTHTEAYLAAILAFLAEPPGERLALGAEDGAPTGA